MFPGSVKEVKSDNELISFTLFIISHPKSEAVFKSLACGLPLANLFVDECSVIKVAAPNPINPFEVKILYCSNKASS